MYRSFIFPSPDDPAEWLEVTECASVDRVSIQIHGGDPIHLTQAQFMELTDLSRGWGAEQIRFQAENQEPPSPSIPDISPETDSLDVFGGGSE